LKGYPCGTDELERVVVEFDSVELEVVLIVDALGLVEDDRVDVGVPVDDVGVVC